MSIRAQGQVSLPDCVDRATSGRVANSYVAGWGVATNRSSCCRLARVSAGIAIEDRVDSIQFKIATDSASKVADVAEAEEGVADSILDSGNTLSRRSNLTYFFTRSDSASSSADHRA